MCIIFTLYDNYVVLLDNGIQYIRDNVGDQFSKDDMIAAITYCNMDAVAALNHLFEKCNYHSYIYMYVYHVASR